MNAPIPPSEMARIADRCRTISDKARALTDAGYSIGQIAKALDRSYQQIRQVVKQYEARKARESQGQTIDEARPLRKEKANATPAGASALFRLLVGEDGRLSLPGHVLEAAEIGPGDVVVGVVEDGRIVLNSARVSMEQAQELVQALLPGDDSLAESLLADRRREVARERTNG